MTGSTYQTSVFCSKCNSWTPKENATDRLDTAGRPTCVDCGALLRTHPKNTHRKLYLRLLEEIG